MDTRLKNKHRLGIFLAWLLVIAAAAGMVSSYPYIWERAASWKIQRETYETEAMNQSRVENLAVLTQNGGYAMWMEEVQNNSGKKLRPSQVFVDVYKRQPLQKPPAVLQAWKPLWRWELQAW